VKGRLVHRRTCNLAAAIKSLVAQNALHFVAEPRDATIAGLCGRSLPSRYKSSSRDPAMARKSKGTPVPETAIPIPIRVEHCLRCNV